MSEWQKVKIGDFLHRQKQSIQLNPDQEYALVTIRVKHKGVQLREMKKGAQIGSKMYQIKKGQFILSGIDARQGAFGIVPDELDGAIVTNDFWAFDVDEKVVKRDFFYWLTTTPIFLDSCIKSSKGETQRIRLQKDDFYNFEFNFPTVEKQSVFLTRLQIVDDNLSALAKEQLNQQTYLTKLRQAILQEAIEGKLTAEWRVKNPVQKGNPDFDAAALLATIKTEKQKLIDDGKIKKEKSLAPIKADDVPFALPDGWVWVRLGECSLNRDDARKPISQTERGRKNKIYPYYGASGVIDKIDGYTHEGKNLLIGEDGANLVSRSTPIAFIADGQYWVNNHAHVIGFTDNTILFFLKIHVNAIDLKPYVTGGFQPKLNQGNLNNIFIALPPLAEQHAIVARVDRLLASVNALEQQVQMRKTYAQQLMQAVLKEAFAE